MTISSVKYAASKASKLKTKKIGKRSICDIINDRPIKLDFDEKVNYIRHKFTYYEGNYDLFNDEKGKPNKRKALLNRVISEVVLKHKDPSILKKLNKKILLWRKDKIEKMQLQLKEKTVKENYKKLKNYRTQDWYKITDDDHPNFERWKEVIIDFIKSPENNLNPDVMQHITYKRLKEIAQMWSVKKGMFFDYNSYLLNKYPISMIVYKGTISDVKE